VCAVLRNRFPMLVNQLASAALSAKVGSVRVIVGGMGENTADGTHGATEVIPRFYCWPALRAPACASMLGHPSRGARTSPSRRSESPALRPCLSESEDACHAASLTFRPRLGYHWRHFLETEIHYEDRIWAHVGGHGFLRWRRLQYRGRVTRKHSWATITKYVRFVKRGYLPSFWSS
jgi:hypothetical protein